jgi:hypothetical protein
MAADGRLYNPGHFLLHRDTAGAAAIDSATINDTNYPPADAFAGTGSSSFWAVWTGAAGSAADTIKVVPLVRNGVVGVWYLTPEITLTRNTLKEITLYEASQIYLRISDVTGTTATDIEIRVALAGAKPTE